MFANFEQIGNKLVEFCVFGENTVFTTVLGTGLIILYRVNSEILF